MILFYYIYSNCKSTRDTVIVVKRFFSLAKTIVVDVIVIYIPRIPVVFFVMGGHGQGHGQGHGHGSAQS